MQIDLASRGDARGGGMADLTPYTVAKIAEDPRRGARKGPAPRGGKGRFARKHWTIAKVAAMTTEAIEEQLRKYGVDYSREAFLDLAAGRLSAWPISDVWRQSRGLRCKGLDVDFLGFAACELWKRLLPERPSMEMLDDWMQEGYELSEQGRLGEACDVWWNIWQVLMERFSPEMTNVEDVDSVFSGRQCVFNWCQDFEEHLHNASIDEPRYAEIGRQYCEEWIGQFPDGSDLMQINFRRALGAFALRLGQADEGIGVLQGIVDRWPRNVWGYVALADEYSGPQRHPALPPDVPRAVEWLKRGLSAVDPGDLDKEALIERIEWLEQEADARSPDGE